MPEAMEEVNVARKGPYIMDVKPGRYAWCVCGRSERQPFCDGSHKGTPFNPIIERVDTAKRVAWCGCKHSSNKPYCDGTHSTI